MSFIAKRQIIQMINSKKYSATSIFRKLAKILIEDDNIWLNNNHESLIKLHPELHACIGKFNF